MDTVTQIQVAWELHKAGHSQQRLPHSWIGIGRRSTAGSRTFECGVLGAMGRTSGSARRDGEGQIALTLVGGEIVYQREDSAPS